MTKGTIGRGTWTGPVATTPGGSVAGLQARAASEPTAYGLSEPARVIEALHQRYAGIVFSVCMRILRNRALAEDAVQDTFLSAFRALPNLRRDLKPLPWLVTIGTNASLKILRSRRRRPLVLDGQNIGQETAPAPQPDQAVTLAWRRALQALLDTLDPRSQHIVVCHHLLGMTQEEVANALGISRRAVVKRLASVRTRAVAAALAEAEDD